MSSVNYILILKENKHIYLHHKREVTCYLLVFSYSSQVLNLHKINPLLVALDQNIRSQFNDKVVFCCSYWLYFQEVVCFLVLWFFPLLWSCFLHMYMGEYSAIYISIYVCLSKKMTKSWNYRNLQRIWTQKFDNK